MSGVNKDLQTTKTSWKQVQLSELPIIPSVAKQYQNSEISGAQSGSDNRKAVLTSNVFNFETQNLERIKRKKPVFQTRKASNKIPEEDSKQNTINSPNSSLDPPSCAHLNFADVARISSPNYHENKQEIPYLESKKFNANRSRKRNSVRQHLSHSTYLSNQQLKQLYTNKFGKSQKLSSSRDRSGQKNFLQNPVITSKGSQKLSVKDQKNNFQALEDLRCTLLEKSQLQFDQSKGVIGDLEKKKQSQIKTAMNMLKRVELQVASSNRVTPNRSPAEPKEPTDQEIKAQNSESPVLKIPIDSKYVRQTGKDSLQASDEKQDIIENLLKTENKNNTSNKIKKGTTTSANLLGNHSFTGNRSKGSASEYAPFNSQVTGHFSRFGVDSQIEFLNKQETESNIKQQDAAKKDNDISSSLKPYEMYQNAKIVPLKSHNFDVSPKLGGRFCGGPAIKNSPKFNNINLQRAPSHSPTSSANLSQVQTENLAVTTGKPSVSQLQSYVGFSPGIPLKNRSIVSPSESPQNKAFTLMTQGQKIKEKESFQFTNLNRKAVDQGTPAMESFNSKNDLMKDNSLDTIGLKELRSLDAKIENGQVTTENDISKIIEVGSQQILVENPKAPGEAHIKIIQQSSEVLMNEDQSAMSSIVQILSKHESKEQVKAVPKLNFDKLQDISQNKYVRYKKAQDLQQAFDYGAVRIANGANSQREDVGLTGMEMIQRNSSTQVDNDEIQLVSKHILSQPPDQASRTAVLQLNGSLTDQSRHSYQGKTTAFHLMATPSIVPEIQTPQGFGSKTKNQVSHSTMMNDHIHNSQGTLLDSATQKLSNHHEPSSVMQNKNVKIESFTLHEGTTSSQKRNNDLDQSMFGDMIPPEKKVKDSRNKRGIGTVEKPQVYQNIINMNLMSELGSQPEKNTEEAAQAFATFAVDSARNNIDSARAMSHLISQRGNKAKLNKKQLAIIGNNLSSNTSNDPHSKRNFRGVTKGSPRKNLIKIQANERQMAKTGFGYSAKDSIETSGFRQPFLDTQKRQNDNFGGHTLIHTMNSQNVRDDTNSDVGGQAGTGSHTNDQQSSVGNPLTPTIIDTSYIPIKDTAKRFKVDLREKSVGQSSSKNNLQIIEARIPEPSPELSHDITLSPVLPPAKPQSLFNEHLHVVAKVNVNEAKISNQLSSENASKYNNQDKFPNRYSKNQSKMREILNVSNTKNAAYTHQPSPRRQANGSQVRQFDTSDSQQQTRLNCNSSINQVSMPQAQSNSKLGFKTGKEKRSTADLQEYLEHLQVQKRQSGLNPDPVKSKRSRSPRSIETTPNFEKEGAFPSQTPSSQIQLPLVKTEINRYKLTHKDMAILKEIGLQQTLRAIQEGQIHVDQQLLDNLTKIHKQQVEQAKNKQMQYQFQNKQDFKLLKFNEQQKVSFNRFKILQSTDKLPKELSKKFHSRGRALPLDDMLNYKRGKSRDFKSAPKFEPLIDFQPHDVNLISNLHPGLGVFAQQNSVFEASKERVLYPNAQQRQENKSNRAKYLAKVQKLEKERIRLLQNNKLENSNVIKQYDDLDKAQRTIMNKTQNFQIQISASISNESNENKSNEISPTSQVNLIKNQTQYAEGFGIREGKSVHFFDQSQFNHSELKSYYGREQLLTESADHQNQSHRKTQSPREKVQIDKNTGIQILAINPKDSQNTALMKYLNNQKPSVEKRDIANDAQSQNSPHSSVQSPTGHMFNLQVKEGDDHSQVSPQLSKKVVDDYQDESQLNQESEAFTSFHVMGSLKTQKQSRLENGHVQISTNMRKRKRAERMRILEMLKDQRNSSSTPIQESILQTSYRQLIEEERKQKAQNIFGVKKINKGEQSNSNESQFDIMSRESNQRKIRNLQEGIIPFMNSQERINIQEALLRDQDGFGLSQKGSGSQNTNPIETKISNTVHQSTQAIVSATPSATDLTVCDSTIHKTRENNRQSQESQIFIDNGNRAQYSREAIRRDMKMLSDSTQNLNNSFYPSTQTFIHKNIENAFKKKEREKYFKKVDDKQSMIDIDQLMEEKCPSIAQLLKQVSEKSI